MTATTGIAVVGSSGHAARVSAPVVASTDGARLAGVLGSSPERGAALASRHPGARAYADWDALLGDPAVEAVWIAGPNHLHAEHAARCLRAGRHVLLEKPMATTLEDARRLEALAGETGRVLLVGFQHRFRPGHGWLRGALRDGLVGEPRLARVHRFWPYPYFGDMPADASASWRTSLRDSGGWALNDIGSHLVDLAAWLLGARLEPAYARTANFRFAGAAAEDTALLVLDSDAGAIVTIEVSNAMSSYQGTVEVHGTGGWVRAEGTFDGGGTILAHDGERREFADVAALDVHRALLRDFLAALGGEPPVGATGAEAAATVAIVEAAAAGHRRAEPALNTRPTAADDRAR